MLLTITTTHQPATNLSFLLQHGPARLDGLQGEAKQAPNRWRWCFTSQHLLGKVGNRCHAASPNEHSYRPSRLAFDSLSVERAGLDHGVGPILETEKV